MQRPLKGPPATMPSTGEIICHYTTVAITTYEASFLVIQPSRIRQCNFFTYLHGVQGFGTPPIFPCPPLSILRLIETFHQPCSPSEPSSSLGIFLSTSSSFPTFSTVPSTVTFPSFLKCASSKTSHSLDISPSHRRKWRAIPDAVSSKSGSKRDRVCSKAAAKGPADPRRIAVASGVRDRFPIASRIAARALDAAEAFRIRAFQAARRPFVVRENNKNKTLKKRGYFVFGNGVLKGYGSAAYVRGPFQLNQKKGTF